MPVSGFQYNSRPYSSFRGTRANCPVQYSATVHHQAATNLSNNHQHRNNSNSNSINNNNNNNNNSINHNGNNSNNKNSLTTSNNNNKSNSSGLSNGNSNGNSNSHLNSNSNGNISENGNICNERTLINGNIHQIGCLSTSMSASAISLKHNNSSNNNHYYYNNGNPGSNFSRQQPFRSSFYGTRYNHKTGTAIPVAAVTTPALVTDNNNNPHGRNSGLVKSNEQRQQYQQQKIIQTTTPSDNKMKPLTPKLIRRIESACTQNYENDPHHRPHNHNRNQQTHGKPKAPQPPVAQSTQNIIASGKQYLRTLNGPPTPPNRKSMNFERFHQDNQSIRQKFGKNCHETLEVNNIHNNLNGGGGSTGKRTYASTTVVTSSRLCKENQCHETNGPSNGPVGVLRSLKSYPAPLPPNNNNGAAKVINGRKTKGEQRLGSSISASPNLNNRRFISSVGINSFNANCSSQKSTPIMSRRKILCNAAPSMVASNSPVTTANTNNNNNNGAQLIMCQKTGSAGSNSISSESSLSQNSPKTKKVFSSKFPEGLPFEEEFYRRYRSYSHQSSSSNYSFYSSAGAPTTPRLQDYNHHEYQQTDDDEFQRKPSKDRSLYVDFSKVLQTSNTNIKKQPIHTTRTAIVPTSTWIGSTSTTTNNDGSSLIETSSTRTTTTPTTTASHSPTTTHYCTNYFQHMKTTSGYVTSSNLTRSKNPHSISEYLYNSTGLTTKNEVKKFITKHYEEPEDGYFTYTSPEPLPTIRTNIYLAVSSWAPECSYPTRLLIPANDSNNNSKANVNHYQRSRKFENGTNVRPEMADTKMEGTLKLTNREYSFDSLSRRRKERSKRSHRKSPTSGRRAHKFRYRDEASHSSSRRRHRDRDRAKDERDSGRINRRSHSKVKTFHIFIQKFRHRVI